MISRKLLVLGGAALALLVAPSGAQSRAGAVFARFNKPLKSASLDLATGTITRGTIVADRGASTTTDFENMDLAGFAGVSTGGGACEWFDAGVKGFAGNHSDLMTHFVFAYCSSMLDPASGGPGGSVKIGFYEGYMPGGGTPTTAVTVLTLSGLPGNSASSSFWGGSTCYFFDVNFGGGLVAFADGPIGYSWGFLDVGTGGTLAGTWPLLSCVVSCSGSTGQIDGQGMTDAIDVYCPPGTLRSIFSYGTASGSYTSISLGIREVTDFAATRVLYNSTTLPNPDILTSTTAVVGSTWSGTITRPAIPAANITDAAVSVRPFRIALPAGVAGPSPPLPAGAGGRILISGPLINTLGTTAVGPKTRTFSTAIPPRFALVCKHFAIQATVIGGGVRVSSAVEGTMGTF
jgi:hypothetical protein